MKKTNAEFADVLIDHVPYKLVRMAELDTMCTIADRSKGVKFLRKPTDIAGDLWAAMPDDEQKKFESRKQGGPKPFYGVRFGSLRQKGN